MSVLHRRIGPSATAAVHLHRRSTIPEERRRPPPAPPPQCRRRHADGRPTGAANHREQNAVVQTKKRGGIVSEANPLRMNEIKQNPMETNSFFSCGVSGSNEERNGSQ
jgi:hypothetical protein